MKLSWQPAPLRPPVTRVPRGHREWPKAFFDKACTIQAVEFFCFDSYDEEFAKDGNHQPLSVYVADHSGASVHWRQLPGRFNTLAEAQAAAQRVFDRHVDWVPEARSDFSDSLLG